jgi:hypothetical protein
MRCRFHGLVAVVVFVWLSGSVLAFGEETRMRVAIVHSGQSKLVTRLRIELSLLGLVPETVFEKSPPTPADLSEIVDDIDAAGVMEVSVDGMRVAIWVLMETGQLEMIQEVYGSGGSDQAQAIIAFKAGELIRAALIHGGEEQQPEEMDGEVIVPPVAKEADESDAETSSRESSGMKRFAFALEPAVNHGFGKLPPAFQLGMQAEFRFSPRFTLSVLGLVPTAPMRMTIDEGEIDINIGVVALMAGVRLTPTASSVSVSANALAGVVLIRMNGRANSPNVSMTQFMLVACVGGDLDLAIAVSEVVSIRADIIAATSIPRPVIGVMEKEVTHWGRPFLVGMLGLEIWIF